MSTAAAVNFFNPIDEDDSPPRMQPSPTLRKTDTAQELRNASLKSVDSDVFDSEGYRMAYAGPAGNHAVSSPFEIAQFPIEIQESKKQQQREITNRARMESYQQTDRDSVCLSPRFNGGAVYEEPEPRSKSPQLVECHTFRDAMDVNFQRMAITGEEISGVPLENLQQAASQLIEAMALREEYMERIGHYFPVTTKYFISGKYPNELPHGRRKNTENSSVNVNFNPPEAPTDHWGLNQPLPTYDTIYTLKRANGVIEIVGEDGKIPREFESYYITKEKFIRDLNTLTNMTIDGELKSFCFRRLTFLQNKFQLHVLLNELRELHEQKSVPHRDFYNIRKVDTHIHAASSMNQKHLLRFIKKKLKMESNTVVLNKTVPLVWGGIVKTQSGTGSCLGSMPTTPQTTIDLPDPPPEAASDEEGVGITLKEVFKKMNINAYDMSVDMLDVHADRNTFHRFDKFNSKYNPVGESTLREIFIKTDNFVDGKYFAEVLKEVLSDLEDSKYQHAEPRLSIYGRKKDEWDRLAKWALTHDVWSPNVRWLVQIPRLYDIYKEAGMIKNFDEILDNVFTPLFEATNDPNSHPELARFLETVSGIDSVDDESKHEIVMFDNQMHEPEFYESSENPPYSYYLFYMYKNLCVLNAFRRARGMCTFALRPHCGEAGGVSHLMAGFLTSESIAHGLMLRKVPVMQYLYYLTQVGIAMSPLSNNSLFINYQRNPLPEYLQKGLNVSLSTDDPLQFHYTKEALMEEYSIAAQVWKFSSCDMCELARNSVLQSGFEEKVKIHWLGPNYKEEGVLGNDITRTNVPDIRVAYRHEALVDELLNLFNVRKLA